ncbi:MAG: L,D-transpeptidase family protein [bacterium]|nr:L,D-transpeptidase family protein [bacterium]
MKRIITSILAVTLAAGTIALYVYGRSLWHPIYVKIAGERSIEKVIEDIAIRTPELNEFNHTKINILVFKQEGTVRVVDRKDLYEFKMTAFSGRLGPKMKSGDGQIPEGIYSITSLNPNSSYHLSMKISYPNPDDLERCKRENIVNPGKDIYIHGKYTSDGCIAIGDKSIEKLFYMVYKVGLDNVNVIIAPSGTYREEYKQSKDKALYERMYNEIDKLYKDS